MGKDLFLSAEVLESPDELMCYHLVWMLESSHPSLVHLTEKSQTFACPRSLEMYIAADLPRTLDGLASSSLFTLGLCLVFV